MKRTRIADDFEVTPRIKELALKNHWPDPDTEFDAFKDYHMAHGSVMADWEAAFRTWLRNAAKWSKVKPGYVSPKHEPYRPSKEEENFTPEQIAEAKKALHDLAHGLTKKMSVK